MFGLGYMEVGIILIVGVLLFGNRLPKVARSLGSSITEFKRGVTNQCSDLEETGDQLKSELQTIEKELKKDVTS